MRLLSGDDVATQLGDAARQRRADGGVRIVEHRDQRRQRAVDSRHPGWSRSGFSGMFNPSPTTTIAMPFTPGPEPTLGPIVNDAYFGKVPADRLIVKDRPCLFRGDGQYRSKIGLPPSRALPVAGSYDAAGHVLTLVQYTRPGGRHRYVNSMWEIQREPYKGDVINSYNDGPPAPGKPPLGPVLRARDLLSRPEPGTRRALHARPSHVSFRRTGT